MTAAFVEQPLALPGSAEDRGRGMLCTLGFPNGRTQHWAGSNKVCLHIKYTFMGDLDEAPNIRNSIATVGQSREPTAYLYIYLD